MRIAPLLLAAALVGAAAPAAAPAAAGAQAARAAAASDSAGVHQAVLDYVEGVYLADTARIVRGVHPELVKFGYWRARPDAEYEGAAMTFGELVDLAKKWNAGRRRDPARMPKEVRIFDVLDKTAAAKLTAEWGVDYFHLAKIDGRWQIVQVLWQSPPAMRTAGR